LLDFDLGGIGEGHHSPLTAYNQTADMFLILDVWKFSEPFWIKTDLLYQCITEIDPDSGKPRGFIQIKQKQVPKEEGEGEEQKNNEWIPMDSLIKD
jgi:hypothetical protein